MKRAQYAEHSRARLEEKMYTIENVDHRCFFSYIYCVRVRITCAQCYTAIVLLPTYIYAIFCLMYNLVLLDTEQHAMALR